MAYRNANIACEVQVCEDFTCRQLSSSGEIRLSLNNSAQMLQHRSDSLCLEAGSASRVDGSVSDKLKSRISSVLTIKFEATEFETKKMKFRYYFRKMEM